MTPHRTPLWNPLCDWMVSRAFAPVCVLTLTILAFQQGVDVSDRGPISDTDFLTQLYYGLGLFTLGGMDLGTPTGGPDFWRAVLWATYFLAPTIAAITVIEGLWRTLRPWLTTHWPWRKHVVIAGAGRVTSACVDALLERYPRRAILVIERHQDDSHWARLQAKPNVYMIRGDITDPSLLSRLRLHKARAMLLLTDNEFANIEVTARLRSALIHPGATDLPLLVRVSDLTLLEAAQPLMTEATVLVNLHQGVATNFHQICARHMQQTQGEDALVLAGFGRFSQTFLRCFLNDDSSKEIRHLHLFDQNADLCWAQFADSLDRQARGQLEAKLTLHTGEVRDPRVWNEVLEREAMLEETAQGAHNLVVVLATSDYAQNLQTALVLRSRLPRAFLAVRTFDRSAFSTQVAQSQDIMVVYADDELKERIAEHWFPQLGL